MNRMRIVLHSSGKAELSVLYRWKISPPEYLSHPLRLLPRHHRAIASRSRRESGYARLIEQAKRGLIMQTEYKGRNIIYIYTICIYNIMSYYKRKSGEDNEVL